MAELSKTLRKKLSKKTQQRMLLTQGDIKRGLEKKQSATLRGLKTIKPTTPKTSRTKSAVTADTARASAIAKGNAAAKKQAQAAWSKWTANNRTAAGYQSAAAKAKIEKKFGVKLS